MKDFDDMRALAKAHETEHKDDLVIHKENCEKAASYLVDAFAWAASSEGADFWSYVYSRLMNISELGD